MHASIYSVGKLSRTVAAFSFQKSTQNRGDPCLFSANTTGEGYSVLTGSITPSATIFSVSGFFNRDVANSYVSEFCLVQVRSIRCLAATTCPRNPSRIVSNPSIMLRNGNFHSNNLSLNWISSSKRLASRLSSILLTRRC